MIGSKTSCRPMRSVIILVNNKSGSRCTVVRICYHSYDYRPNWTPLSPMTIAMIIDTDYQSTVASVFKYHHFNMPKNVQSFYPDNSTLSGWFYLSVSFGRS